MKSLKNSNINPENLENLALIIPRDSGLAQSREIRDPVTGLESLDLTDLKIAMAYFPLYIPALHMIEKIGDKKVQTIVTIISRPM